jgi:cell division protease FtsH
MQNRNEYSQKTSKEIDNQIIAIASNGIKHAINLLSDKVTLMDSLVDELVDKETLEADYLINKLNLFLSEVS